MRGTREGVLRDIGDWFESEASQRIFWLNGLAGTGKSTIAQTFADTSFADGKLGASFFCSRDIEDHSNLQMIFPSLAFELACRYPHFRQELLEVLKKQSNVGHESLSLQMEKLLISPLKATHTTTLIIIDALDECKDSEPTSTILSILSHYVGQIPTVKFFITGCPEPQICSGFQLRALAPITEVLKLHEIEPEVVDGDIELLFRTRLGSIAGEGCEVDPLEEDWPSPSDIAILCKKAAGFFAYPSAVMKFVASIGNLPATRLSIITSHPQSTIEEGRSGLDHLYTQILHQAFSSVHAGDSQPYIQFRTVVGTTLLLLTPLSIRGLSNLLGCDTHHIINTTNSLHSLLLMPESIEEPIRAFHKSFPEFLMDPSRCQDKWLVIEPIACHEEILLACLGLMEKELKTNIYNLDDYTVLSEVKGLPTYGDHVEDALKYACKFWTKHLLEIPSSSPHAEEVQKAIDKFFTIYLLHWIEVLAITRNLGLGVYAMNDIKQWYNLVSSMQFTCWNLYS